MGTQISFELSDTIFRTARNYADSHGFDTVQDFIKELLREKLFEDEPERFGGMYTYLASEESLARSWLSQEEEEAWAHLQKEI